MAPAIISSPVFAALILAGIAAYRFARQTTHQGRFIESLAYTARTVIEGAALVLFFIGLSLVLYGMGVA